MLDQIKEAIEAEELDPWELMDWLWEQGYTKRFMPCEIDTILPEVEMSGMAHSLFFGPPECQELRGELFKELAYYDLRLTSQQQLGIIPTANKELGNETN
jgi:hypothetical protein